MFRVDDAGAPRVDPRRQPPVRNAISFFNDHTFKTVLGAVKNERLIIRLLNAVLDLDDDHRIGAITLLNPFNIAFNLDDKQSCVDVEAMCGRFDPLRV